MALLIDLGNKCVPGVGLVCLFWTKCLEDWNTQQIIFLKKVIFYAYFVSFFFFAVFKKHLAEQYSVNAQSSFVWTSVFVSNMAYI